MTPHDPLVFHAADGSTVELPAEGVARLAEESRPLRALNVVIEDRRGSPRPPVALELPLVELHYSHGDPLPAQDPGTVLIVSQLLAQAFPHRDDLVFPADLVRDAAGTIVGFRALARPAR